MRVFDGVEPAGSASVPTSHSFLLRGQRFDVRVPRRRHVIDATRALRTAQRKGTGLEWAKAAAGLDTLEGRLSWHSLRHSAGSVWLTEYGIPVTTVSEMMGHANPSFTLACYGRDPRDTETMVADVLARAAAAGS